MAEHFSLESERAVIGAMMLDPDCITEACDNVSAGDFFDRRHRTIFGTLIQIQSETNVADPILLVEHLRRSNELETAGGLDYLNELQDVVPTAAHVQYHAKIVAEHAQTRNILDVALAIEGAAKELTGEQLTAKVESMVLDVTGSSNARRGIHSVGEVMPRVTGNLQERMQLRAEGITGPIGVPTGIPELDSISTGYHNGELIIPAARPSAGKTSLAVVGCLASSSAGVPTALFSLEMPKEAVTERLLACVSDVDLQKLRTGELDDFDVAKVARADARIKGLPMWIDDTAGRNVLELSSAVRRIVRKHDIGIVYIDYLGLIAPHDRRYASRNVEVQDISRSLQALARQTNIPIVVLCQLNRGPEYRSDGKPKLSDLRDSGAIEQDADVVLLLWRDPSKENRRPFPPTTIVVAKQRNGPTGEFDVLYDKKTGRILPIDPIDAGESNRAAPGSVDSPEFELGVPAVEDVA